MTSKLRTLIFMPAHAIYLRDRVSDEANWFLFDFQKGNGHLERLIQHVEAACRLTRDTPDALLVFSGGQTRPGVHRTEGESQIEVAHRLGLLRGIEDRVTSENEAMDSAQNCAFSIARFIEMTGKIPEQRCIAVGWEFKALRFKFHMSCLTFPNEFQYVGVNNPPESHLPAALASESSILNAFREDPFGLKQPLSGKKRDRNWARRNHGYSRAARRVWPEFADILDTQFD